MASHGRRHASAKTIERKKAKKAMRKANTRLRKIDDSDHFSYLVNHVLAKLGDISFTDLTELEYEVNEIVQELNK